MIPVGQTNTIKLDVSEAGEGHVTCHVTDESGTSVDVDVIEPTDTGTDFVALHARHGTAQNRYDLQPLESPLQSGDCGEYTPD